jgi:hypothetical protein
MSSATPRKTRTLKEELIPTLLKFFPQNRKGRNTA